MRGEEALDSEFEIVRVVGCEAHSAVASASLARGILDTCGE